MLRRSNPTPTQSFTNIHSSPASDAFPDRPRLLTDQAGRPWLRVARMVMFALVAAFLSFAAVSEARADVFTKNQRLVSGASPATILLTDDGGLSFTGTVPAGTVVHIIYGIQVNAGNTSTSPVSLGITLPSAFSPTSTVFNPTTVRCVKFPGGSAVGAPFTAGCTLPNVSIGALSATDDKVIVVVDGIFTQAGAFTAGFTASRTGVTESTSLNMNAAILNLPVDIGITKQVKPLTSGSFGSTATLPITPVSGTLRYKVKVTNNSLTDPLYHSTDVYLGRLLRLEDQLSTPSGVTQDVVLSINLKNFACTSSALSVPCPTLPGNWSPTLGLWSSWNLPTITYPSTSNGFLPAGGWFEITFDAEISTASLCSPHQNNKLMNVASFTYSNGTTTVSDINPSNNTSVVTTANVQTPNLPVICPLPLGVQVIKTILVAGSWTTPFTYKITVTNTNTTTLTGLSLTDQVKSTGVTPAFTATPSNVVCTSCNGAPSLYTQIVNPGNQMVVLTANFAPLAPNTTHTVQYKVQYSAPCASSTSAGSIENYAFINGPANGFAFVQSPMVALPICPLQVTKSQISGPTTFATFPVTDVFQVVFKNTSPTQTLQVRTLIDSIGLDSPNYGDVPIDYSYTCTQNGVSGASPLSYTSPLTPQPIMAYNNPVWAGTRLIDFSSPGGITFNPLGTLTCLVTVKLKQPSPSDSKCQGAGTPNFVQSAFMDMSYPYNTNLPQTPAFYAKVIRPLPKCVSISVGKTVSANVIAGQAMTFTLTVKNAGNDPTPTGIKLLDNVPGGFTVTGWSCLPLAACSPSTGGAGNNIVVNLNPIPGGNTTTVTVNAIAPSVPGTTCNIDSATFNPFPPLTFFEGNQSALTTASACVQVNPPPPGLPTLTKSFKPSVVALGQPVQVTFTLTNAAGTGPQTGLHFSDALPNPPFTGSTLVSNTCGGTAIANGNILSLSNGSLPAGPSTCTIVFMMAPPTACGVFPNNKHNLHEVGGLDVSGMNTSLTVHCEPVETQIQKVVVGVPPGFAGTFNFNVTCTAPGGSPVSSIKTIPFASSDPLVLLKGGLQGKTKTVLIGTLPAGTSCTVTEVAPMPPAPPGCMWVPPTYSPANGTIIATPPGPVRVRVENRWACHDTTGGAPSKN